MSTEYPYIEGISMGKRDEFLRLELMLAFDYNPETGLFRWRESPNNRVKAGAIAGKLQSAGYIQLTLNKERILAHRAAFLIVYGWLPDTTDHIDEDKANNRIANLRPISHQHNTWRARKKAIKANGLPQGVARLGKGYVAKLWFGVRAHIKGPFDTAEEASMAYKDAAMAFYGEVPGEADDPSSL